MKIPKIAAPFMITAILEMGVLLTVGTMMGCDSGPDEVTLLLEEKDRELAERDRQILGMDDQIAELRKELEENSKQVAGLRAKMEESEKALSSTKKKLKSAERKIKRLAATSALLRKKIARKPIEQSSPAVQRRPAEPGTYEVIRTTSVFEKPSGTSRTVSSIDVGTKVSVVRSVGEWLEVRSKHGKPPGFIRRDDAMFVKRKN